MARTKTLTLLVMLQLCYLSLAELNLQEIEIPDMDDFAAIKEKCDRLGGGGTYDTLKASKDSLQSCMQGFVDFAVLKKEVEEAKKTGSMDEVFGKYCNKRPKLSACVQNFTSALKPCLNDDERKALNTTLDILKQLGEFVCYRDGDRLAMFVAEGGVECIKDHTEGIKNCVNNTLKITPTVNTNSLPSLLMDKKKCDDLVKLQTCVVQELEKCQDSTPANIIDALFRFIKRSACSNKHRRSLRSVITKTLPIAVGSMIYNRMKEKCEQNAPEGGYDNFSESLENANDCLSSKINNEPILATSKEELKEKIKKCFESFIEKAKVCLSEEEQFWPQYQVDVILNLTEVVYKNQGLILGPNLRSELINCFQNIRQQNTVKEITKCLDIPTSGILSKEIYCKGIKTAQDCFKDQYKKKCIQDVAINRLFDDIFNALKTPPCDKI